MSLLEVKDLKTYFHTRRGVIKAVNGVSYSVDAGRTLGIVGESGSGKTTLLNILAAFIPPVAGVVIMDYFVIQKADPLKWKATEGVNWAGIISWIGGSVFALAFPSIFVPTINGIVVACVLYVILYPVLAKSKKEA